MTDQPFSLQCFNCDAGVDINSQAEAESLGWQNIVDDADGLAWNYLGDCPDCLTAEQAGDV